MSCSAHSGRDGEVALLQAALAALCGVLGGAVTHCAIAWM